MKKLIVTTILISSFIGGLSVEGGGKVPKDAPVAEEAPCVEGGGAPIVKEGKRLWAHSFLWAKAPDFVVEKWLTDKPDTEGKYVMIEFWATWCGACKRAVPKMNGFQKKFADEMVIIGVSDEDEETVRDFIKAKGIKHPMAIDTQARMKDELGIYGIPHIIILEPGGFVIWEGFPLLPGYELTDEIIEKILEIGRKQKAAVK